MEFFAAAKKTAIEKIPVRRTIKNGRDVYTLAANEVGCGFTTLDFMPDFATAKAGTDGYFIVPAIHCCYMARFTEHKDTEIVSANNLMPIYGAKRGNEAFVAIVTGMSYEYHLVQGVKDGVYYQFPRFNLFGECPYEDITVEIVTLTGNDANYAGMARAYRQFQLSRGACAPLREKVKDNETLKFAVDSIEIRVRNGWKPAPPPILEQTVQNEPPMKVAMTFDRTKDVIEACARQGFKEIEFCLVGWNQKGHDGRWPQILPVEEALGGETGLRSLTKRARELGYAMIGHTNNSDAYTIADSWDEEYIIKQPDGSLSTNAAWSGGKMYNVCPQRGWERFAQYDLAKVALMGFHGLHYIDVLTIVPPRRCFDPAHPCTAKDSAEWLNKILARAKEEIGGCASEGGCDFSVGVLDYALYVGFSIMKGPAGLDTEPIPLWQLVYHGIVLSNPSSETVNHFLKNQETRLRLIEYGGRPLIYYYSKFRTDSHTWMGINDCTCDSEQEFDQSIEQIKSTLEEYRKLRHLQYEFMEDHHKITDGVFETVYSNGSRIVVDYNEKSYTLDGKKVQLS